MPEVGFPFLVPFHSRAAADIMPAIGAPGVSESTEVLIMTGPGMPSSRSGMDHSEVGGAVHQPIVVDERRADIDCIAERISGAEKQLSHVKDRLRLK